VTRVVDASVVAAALIDAGPEGTWAEGLLEGEDLAAPHLMPVEVASVLRRCVAAGDLAADSAALAHADLQALRVELFPYAPFADRVWAMRGAVTACDAWYVALAELLGASLATLDARLARARGPRCRFELPPPRSRR
jgi:predicted nucleic acid-binding protein